MFSVDFFYISKILQLHSQNRQKWH